MPRMLRNGLFTAACAILLLAGCVLFVDDRSDYSTTCHFDGDSRTPCGLCIATSCQPAVNACCGAATCDSAVAELDPCGGGGDCTALVNESTSDQAERKSLGQCVKDHCAAVCAATTDGGAIPPPGGAPVSCGDNSAGFVGCTCVGEPSVVSSSGTCSAASLGLPADNVICCADKNYPATTGSACQCSHVSCDQPTSDSCACGADVTDGTDGTTCTKPSGGTCCNSTTTSRCFCGATKCSSGFVDMGATCASSNVTCPTSKQHVTACR